MLSRKMSIVLCQLELSEISESEEKSVDIATPYTSIEEIDTSLVGLFHQSDASKAGDIAKQVGLKDPDVARALSAARDLGLTEVAKGKGRGAYQLTSPGKDYARYIEAGKPADAKTILKDQILKSSSWVEIVKFLTINKARARELRDLVVDIEKKLNKTWSTGSRKQLSAAYGGILKASGLATVSGGNITSLLGGATTLPSETLKQGLPPDSGTSQHPPAPPIQPPGPGRAYLVQLGEPQNCPFCDQPNSTIINEDFLQSTQLGSNYLVLVKDTYHCKKCSNTFTRVVTRQVGIVQ